MSIVLWSLISKLYSQINIEIFLVYELVEFLQTGWYNFTLDRGYRLGGMKRDDKKGFVNIEVLIHTYIFT